MKAQIHSALRRLGLDIVRYDGRLFPERRRAELMRRLNVQLVIDVGANMGQYIDRIRASGYTGKIVAFEPLSEPYEWLLGKAGVIAHQIALGSHSGDTTINVARDSWSSSLLPSDRTTYVRRETVPLRTLDSFGLKPDWVKIDTQGYELEVIRGGRETLRQARGVEVELSYVPSYEGQPAAEEVCEALRELGFGLAAFGLASNDPGSGLLVEIDALFVRA